jgi:SAM-dependent methyltransferase
MAVVPQQILNYISRQEEEELLKQNQMFLEGQGMLSDLNQNITDIDLPRFGNQVGMFAKAFSPTEAISEYKKGNVVEGSLELADYLKEMTGYAAVGDAFGVGLDVPEGRFEDRTSLIENVINKDFVPAALQLFDITPFGRIRKGIANIDDGKLSINNEKPVVDGVNVDPSRTQRSNTTATYEKLGNYLQQQGIEGDVLDFGAGFGLGTPKLGAGSKTFEPYPQGDFVPDFDDVGQISSNSFPSVTSVNNLNVMPPEIRDQAVKDIGRILQPDGQAVITVRPRADVNNAKNFKPVDEDGAKLVFQGKDKTTGEDIYTYQKGYTPKELKEYVSSILGEDNFKVETLTKKDTGISVPQVKITKLSSNTPDDSLIVQHNLYLETLDDLEAIGALPNPSMAITKADMPLQGFGDVTLLGTPDMAKPSARNPVYRADAYTMRRPNIETVDPVTGEKIKPRFYNQYKYRYEEATPEKLSRYMRGGSGEEAMGLIAGKARALAAKPFKTFKEIKDARNKIISGYDEVQVKKDFSNTFEKLGDSVFEDMKNNVPAFKGKDTLNYQQVDSIRYDLKDLVSGKFDPEVMELLSEETKKQLFDFHEIVQDLPASYFEVNPQRPVELREFANVLVPEGTSKQDILKLERLGANKITTYKDGADKVNKIKGTKEALFVATPAFILAQQLMEEDEESSLLEEDLYKRLGMDDF